MTLNDYWTDIYYYLHYHHGEEKLTHQMIRLMQHISKTPAANVRDVASFLEISHNTASEHIKRLVKKDYVAKIRATHDERTVLLSLTARGEKALLRHTHLDETKLAIVLAHLSTEERDMAAHALKRLSEEAKRCFSS
ncbi:MarR family winged helix-turn-helix transcriptional regulator [Shouchella lonarensis]|uniref:HTH-type transcriptional regulator SarZ n=1 Tax=Shouchella lonarensis TaxID=1464122 RepID=A0A1G6INM3_9BACI|nr:MarR family transcriptional regulator [Shouchella lonarensis]SDC08099.1 DNA-binding transcriptional regulator, MarR family [Shouchella lonarensis]